MLTVGYIDDERFLEGLFARLGDKDVDFSGINAVLYDGDDAIGLCKLFMDGRTITIGYFKVVNEVANEPLIVDFFFRAILYKLSLSDVSVFIKTDDKRLIPFGFKSVDGGMAVESDEIEFPSSCGGH